jgi:HrpA-like RNA helicase
MLVFLTSAEEVHAFLGIVNDLLADSHSKAKMLLLPLYANLPLDKQLDIFKAAPPGVRKQASSIGRQDHRGYEHR